MLKLSTMTKTLLCGLLLDVLAPLATTGCADNCEPCDCADLGDGDLETNGRTNEKCLACSSSGGCVEELRDDNGETFHYCDDREDGDCLSRVVAAQYAHCAL